MCTNVKEAKLIGNSFVALNQIVLIRLNYYIGKDKYSKIATYRDRKYFIEGRVKQFSDTFLTLDISTQFLAQSISISYDEIEHIEIIG